MQAPTLTHAEPHAEPQSPTRAPVAPTQSAWESAHDIEPGDLIGLDFSDCLSERDW